MRTLLIDNNREAPLAAKQFHDQFSFRCSECDNDADYVTNAAIAIISIIERLEIGTFILQFGFNPIGF